MYYAINLNKHDCHACVYVVNTHYYCNILYRAIGKIGTIYPDGLHELSRGHSSLSFLSSTTLAMPWELGRKNWEFLEKNNNYDRGNVRWVGGSMPQARDTLPQAIGGQGELRQAQGDLSRTPYSKPKKPCRVRLAANQRSVVVSPCREDLTTPCVLLPLRHHRPCGREPLPSKAKSPIQQVSRVSTKHSWESCPIITQLQDSE